MANANSCLGMVSRSFMPSPEYKTSAIRHRMGETRSWYFTPMCYYHLCPAGNQLEGFLSAPRAWCRTLSELWSFWHRRHRYVSQGPQLPNKLVLRSISPTGTSHNTKGIF